MFDTNRISNIEQQVEQIVLYHSKDDPSVPYASAERLSQMLLSAKLFTFEDRGHFGQDEFPELLENIIQHS